MKNYKTFIIVTPFLRTSMDKNTINLLYLFQKAELMVLHRPDILLDEPLHLRLHLAALRLDLLRRGVEAARRHRRLLDDGFRPVGGQSQFRQMALRCTGYRLARVSPVGSGNTVPTDNLKDTRMFT